jgi:hypothetical protein
VKLSLNFITHSSLYIKSHLSSEWFLDYPACAWGNIRILCSLMSGGVSSKIKRMMDF